MSKKLLALVKWVGGEDDKKYTPGIPVEWIKSFNYEEFISETNLDDSSYVIEWRTSAKEPLGGWDCYDGIVVAVSDRLSVLKNQLKKIDGHESPKKLWQAPKDGETSDLESQQKENIPDIGNKAAPATVHKINEPTRKRKLILESHSGSDDAESGITAITENPNLIRQMVENNRTIAEQLQKVCKELKQGRKRRSRRSDSSSSDSSSNEAMVRIGPKKSRIAVTETQWRCAKAASTFTAMGLSLLSALFPVETLLKSNLKGGKSRIKTSTDGTSHQALDKNIVDAIYYTVQSHFPKTFNRTAMGTSINNKLFGLRRAFRKPGNGAEVPGTSMAQQE